MKLRINIESGNEGVQSHFEVADLVEKVAKKIRQGRVLGPISDVNGNRVGSWLYEPEETDEDEDESEV